MRGKVFPVPPQVLERRITPAYAGKSSFSTIFIKISEDHPRLCGEKRGRLTVGTLGIGSPPPMRGKVVSLWELRKNPGITPAYAGKREVGKLDQNNY